MLIEHLLLPSIWHVETHLISLQLLCGVVNIILLELSKINIRQNK